MLFTMTFYKIHATPIDLCVCDKMSLLCHMLLPLPRPQVYWTEDTPPSIMRANIDGTEVEEFINSSIGQPEAMAVDPYAGNLYWADSRLDM